jgi:hypothetical protein
VFFLFSVLLLVFSYSTSEPFVKGTSYIPAAPEGTTFGYINIDYEYRITTLNLNASWRFDWGDGTITPWFRLGKGQTAIIQTHRWTSPGIYPVRVEFKDEQVLDGLWSDPMAVTIVPYTTADIPTKPIFVCGTIQGFIRSLYYYTVSIRDNQTNQLSYTIDWWTSNPSAWIPLPSPQTTFVVSHIWNTSGEYLLKVKVRNQYNLESPWSDPLYVKIQNTTNDTGKTLDLIVLNGVDDYIMFLSLHNGTFYNSSSQMSSDTYWTGGDAYLIDDDNDGVWDYQYAPITGEITSIFQQPPTKQNLVFGMPWTMLLLIIGGIIVGIICVIVALIKTGFIYIVEEKVVEK